MFNKERVIQRFLDMVKIGSPSFDERRVADYIIEQAKSIGLECHEDDKGKEFGGNTGNLYLRLKGDNDKEPLLLMAHMDTVGPCENRVIVEDGDIIKTDGTTTLGGDDLAGVASILEAMQVLKESGNNREVEAVFTFGEEVGLCGSKVLDYTFIKAKKAVMLDSDGPIGLTTIAAPSIAHIEIEVTGKAAHAGVEPEKGISAIEVAANAVAKLPLGRIDSQTTANIGTFKAEGATNVVSPKAIIVMEARSISDDSFKEVLDKIKAVFEATANEFGAKVKIDIDVQCKGFSISEDSELCRTFSKACEQVGIKAVYESSGGGTDANNVCQHGIQAINTSCGMANIHSTEEYIDKKDIYKTCEVLIAFLNL